MLAFGYPRHPLIRIVEGRVLDYVIGQRVWGRKGQRVGLAGRIVAATDDPLFVIVSWESLSAEERLSLAKLSKTIVYVKRPQHDMCPARGRATYSGGLPTLGRRYR